MAILGGLTLFREAVGMAEEAQRTRPTRTGRGVTAPLSPWATSGNLSHVGWDAEVFGSAPAGPVTWGEALRCGPVKKGRAILHGVLASRPLRAIAYDAASNADTVLTGDQAPTWLYRTDTDFPPEQRMADLLDDHIGYEASVLALLRGKGAELGGRGQILDAVHLPYDWWRVDEAGVLLVDDTPVDPNSVLYIPGPSQGLTVEAADEVRQWRAIARNIGIRLRTPTPSIILSDPEADTSDLDDDEVQALVDDMAAARLDPNGAVLYAGRLQVQVVAGNDDAGLYIASRNALRLDFGNHLNMPASLLDGSPATASLTYSTHQGDRSEFADLSLDYWTTPITRALSQDAVVPRGTRVRFDFGDLFATTNAPTGAQTQD